MWKRDDAVKPTANSKEGQPMPPPTVATPASPTEKSTPSSEAATKPPVAQPPDPPVRSVLMTALEAALEELNSKQRRVTIRLNRLRSLPTLASPDGKRVREDEMARLTELKEQLSETEKKAELCFDLESVDYAISENGK